MLRRVADLSGNSFIVSLFIEVQHVCKTLLLTFNQVTFTSGPVHRRPLICFLKMKTKLRKIWTLFFPYHLTEIKGKESHELRQELHAQ